MLSWRTKSGGNRKIRADDRPETRGDPLPRRKEADAGFSNRGRAPESADPRFPAEATTEASEEG